MKIDLAKSDKHYYTASTEPELRTFDGYDYLAVAGTGAPLGPEYSAAVSALYRAAYGVKKLAKAAGQDFVVPKLEGLWWVDSDRPPLSVPREEWLWRLLIRLPEAVTAEMTAAAVSRPVTVERLTEGPSIQALHLGPYATEPETLARMADFMAAQGLTMNGRHHEIYLSDPRRAGSATKTILRHPVRPSR
ncbi:GyrI-like domain-containing protein [Nocardia sp. NPDC048505]|uniref:GyrI-like domain-containing protein n=1 Tax=Nocardia sp. NPDC048505 TaxID=3155756 RepID=UPI0033CB563A